jgi:hypothetical protein
VKDRADGEPLRVVACLLDEEGPVETVRLADASDDDVRRLWRNRV